jgi:hypothetical protein
MLQSLDSFVVHLSCNKEYRIVLQPAGNVSGLQERVGGKWSDAGTDCRFAIRKVCEIEVPLLPLALSAGDYVFISLVHQRGNDELGRWPADAPMKLVYAGGELELDTWLI